jgi:hypothetical protein
MLCSHLEMHFHEDLIATQESWNLSQKETYKNLLGLPGVSTCHEFLIPGNQEVELYLQGYNRSCNK